MKTPSAIKTVINYLTHIFSNCPLCSLPYDNIDIKNNELFCTTCMNEINTSLYKTPLTSDETILEEKHKFNVHSIFKYENKARSVLIKYKIDCNIKFSSFYVPYIKQYLDEQNLNKNNSVFVPLPPSQKGFKERGFDQCIEIIKQLDIPYIDAIMVNKNYKEEQKNLSAYERREQTKGKFMIQGDALKQIITPNIILFDDVFTTGSSMRECIKLIYDNLEDKNVNIIGLTLYKEELLLS